MNDRSTILSSLRSYKMGLLALPFAFASGACDDGSTRYETGSGGAPSAGGTGGASASGGSGGSTGGSAGGGTGGSSAGSGGIPPLGGGPNIPETVACAGPFPTDDVSAATHKASASAATSWGALPHFWTTFGLGRIGLYLDQSELAAEHQAQDKLNFDGLRWSQVLKDHTTDAVQNLGLTSIRAHGLFHDDIGIYKEVNGEPVYDFTRSDLIFDFLVAQKIAPIIELASMPAALAADPSQTVFDWKMIVSPPKADGGYERWQGLVQAFVQHSVDKYGADVVNNWYFEVWNEPECCSGKFWKGSFDDYLKLYDASAAGVRAVLPNGRVGGPVSSQSKELTGGQMAGIKFLDHIKNTGAPLGFFTFHTWDFINGAVGGYFTGLDLLDSYQQNTVQIAVTEFGPTWQFGLAGGDGEPAWEPQETNQGAVFVAQVYSNIAQRCAKEGKRFPITYAWWTLSDVFDEGYEAQGDYVLEENPFIGAMGLLNRENIKKPAYNAYKFLAQLGDEQLELTVEGAGDVGGMAARDRSDSGVQVILYNGQDPGDGFSSNMYYQTAAAQDIGITVSGLNPEVTYDVTAYRIDETHGNSFGAWEGLGKKKMAEMTEADWTTLRTAMDSPPEPVGTAMCGSTFSKTFSVSSPGVVLLTIEPSLPK